MSAGSAPRGQDASLDSGLDTGLDTGLDVRGLDSPAVCVLASGSSGNCAVLVVPRTEQTARRVILLDAGLSPSRTAKLLHERGIRQDEVDEIVFTHLDSDHCHNGWSKAMSRGGWGATLRVHRMHMSRAERMGLLYTRCEPFDDEFTPAGNIRFSIEMLAHDDLGVATFRIAIDLEDGTRAQLGYATDLGRVTPGLIKHLGSVDVLAIESNYCPDMQMASARPAFLKNRIMGGSGHLSNDESAFAVARMNPREHLVLLHLSRECNTPQIAQHAHRDHQCPVTISTQLQPTRWVPIRGSGSLSGSGRTPALPAKQVQGRLFARQEPTNADS